MSRLSTKTLTAITALALLTPLAGCTLPGSQSGYDALTSSPDRHPLDRAPSPSDAVERTSGPPSRSPDKETVRLDPPAVRPVSFDQPAGLDQVPKELDIFPPEKSAEGVENQEPNLPGNEIYPIDLAGALTLGGANNLQIQLVRERVREAQLNYAQARIMWVPSLRAGVGYNRHDGRLQATEGEVVDADRNSLFIGGGAVLGTSSPAGGSNGPARLVMDLSLADVWFEKLAAKQMFCAAAAARTATVNDTLLAISLAYYELAEAHGLLADAKLGLAATEEMVDLTSKFAQHGQIAESEVARAKAARGLRQQEVEDAQRMTLTRSAELVRLLRLHSQVELVPAEERLVPVEIVEDSTALDELLATGLSNRPELRRYQHLVAATNERIRQEHWRPWLPHLAVGYSAGTFGGGPSGTFENQNGRGDFDALAVWELYHLGVGNHVLRRQRDSQNRQANLQFGIVRDRVIAEVTIASADLRSYRRQIDSTTQSIDAAEVSYRLNLQRIRQGEGLPIELLQAIRARTDAQDAYTRTVTNYNGSQFRLLRALGRPPALGGP